MTVASVRKRLTPHLDYALLLLISAELFRGNDEFQGYTQSSLPFQGSYHMKRIAV